MKKILICLTIIAFFSFSCKKSENILSSQNIKKDTMTIQKNNSVEKVLEKQLIHGYGLKEDGLDIFSNYPYDKEDYNAIKLLSKEILKSNGYKMIDYQKFKYKIKEIFNIEYNDQLINILIENPCKMDKITYQLDENYILSNNNPIFIEDNIILESLFVPELIDYKNKYSKISQIENDILKQRQINSDKYTVIKWTDRHNLQEMQFINTQKLIHRNKYLFNDNRSSLAWLKFNDEYFLESLVKTFGYTEDKDLLGWVMERNKEKVKARELINSSVFVRNCKGELEIRNGILRYIEEHTTESEESQSFAFELGDYDVENPDFGWTAKERFKIMAYIANTYDYLYLKSSTLGNTNRGRISYLGGIFSISNKNDNEKSWNELVKNFKANNYYNLPHLKEAVEHAYEYESFEL